MLTKAPTVVQPKVPEVPLEERIRINAENRRETRLKGLTDRYGAGGVMKIIKDYI
jgi:hypothetical protein